MIFALFVREEDGFVPQDLARSLWKEDQMHGVATSGLLARACEQAVGQLQRSELTPARYSVDLFRAPSMGPCRTETTIVRQGSRIVIVDANLLQDGEVVARASAMFLAKSANPAGAVWTPDEVPQPPPVEIAPVSEEPRVPIFASASGWSQNFAEHQNAGRKMTWHTAMPVVYGEKNTPFVGLGGVVDATSMVVNWGEEGVQYINSDISVALSRLPVSQEMGLSAATWSAHEGISVGSAIIFDREGVVGVSTTTAIANARRSVDFTKHTFDEHTDPVANPNPTTA